MESREWRSLPDDMRETLIEHQTEAPVKLSVLANSLGVTVKAATLPPGISGEIRPDCDRDGRFIIRVNKHDPARRQRFTVAHELAHFLLHKDQIGAGIRDDVLYRSNVSDHREAQANRLAADILMPHQLVDQWMTAANRLGADNVIAYLADRFEVSEASMKIRLGLT